MELAEFLEREQCIETERRELIRYLAWIRMRQIEDIWERDTRPGSAARRAAKQRLSGTPSRAAGRSAR